VNLFDPELKVQREITISAGTRSFLLDLDAVKSEEPRVLASACKALPSKREGEELAWTVEGVADTRAIVLIASKKAPETVTLDGKAVESVTHVPEEGLIYLRFPNTAAPRDLSVKF